ncbi:MAG: alkyl hydroperoxide reductase [Pyrinomonadaceae bacterium]
MDKVSAGMCVLAKPLAGRLGCMLLAAAAGGSIQAMDERPDHTRWMSWWLYAAAVYNIAWGAWVVLWPLSFFRLAGLAPPNYPEIWQCVGMVVGVYGVGYAIAARDPMRHWPVVLVGFLGKLFGPVGFVRAALSGSLPWAFGIVNLTNDLIWLAPFALILYGAHTHARRRADGRTRAVAL